MPPVGQDAIAKRLNLSIATVSRSLANHPAISAETRDRVQRLADELGYKRRHSSEGTTAAGNPKTARAGVLVGIQPNSSPLATFPFILKGLQERAQAENISVDIHYVDPNQLSVPTPANPILRLVRENKWRGIVLIYPYAPEAVAMLVQKLPVVTMMDDYDDINIDSIDTNNYSGITTIVNRLARLGHRKIGFVTWAYPTTGHWSTQRFAAYVTAIFANGLEFRPDWILNMHRSEPARNISEIAAHVAQKIREDGVRAWICAADHQAYQLIMDLATRGLRAPEHYSISGFDGIAPPPSLDQVTTQRVPNEAIGAAAIVRLVNRIRHPHAQRRKIFVDTEFVQGATIGPPPSEG